MGIENRFLFRTGAESTDSLESLANLLYDSAYRFRSRQMHHDVTHTRCFVLVQNAANMAPPRKKRIVRSHQTQRGDMIPFKANVETRIGLFFQERKPAASFDCRATLSPCTGERVHEDLCRDKVARVKIIQL
jgi:hypothetical protein